MKDKLIQLYKQRFNKSPDKFFTSPCRINIIGEHTDYNGGLALPAAISRYICAVVGKRDDRKIFLKSLDKTKEILIDVDQIKNKKENYWCNYPLGIFKTLQNRGVDIPFGLNIIFDSNAPIASGLSSSAALLDLTGFIASTMYGLDLSNKDIALLAHQSETEFNGLQCGVMDEMAIALGKKDKCILLDCKTNDYQYIDLKIDRKIKLVVIVSNVKRQLVHSPYNTRVEECQEGLRLIKEHFNIESLSDINVSDLPMVRNIIKDDVIYKRVKHVVTENERVRQFVEAFKDHDSPKIISLINESHESLRDDYEVTGEYLDYIHELALKYGAFASRMTGAGFGGSSIAAIREKEFPTFKDSIMRDYYARFKIKPLVFIADISDGLTVEEI